LRTRFYKRSKKIWSSQTWTIWFVDLDNIKLQNDTKFQIIPMMVGNPLLAKGAFNT
jgi:hypothetical protein